MRSPFCAAQVLRLAAWLSAAALALGVAGCTRREASAGPAAKAPAAAASKASPAPAPAWKLKDLDGRTVESAQFKGKVLVIDFWATWCGPCRAEIPGYIELQNKYRDKGLVILGVSLDQGGPEVVREFVRKNGVNYPIVMGDEAIVAAFGGVEAIPTTFVIDREGAIRFSKQGSEPKEQFEQRLLPWLK